MTETTQLSGKIKHKCSKTMLLTPQELFELDRYIESLLRVDPDEGIGFFEADGGIWKLEAKKNIADYFLKNMGDLIDAGKVVVMQ